MLLDPVNHLVSCPSVQVKGGRQQGKWSGENTLPSESRSLFFISGVRDESATHAKIQNKC